MDSSQDINHILSEWPFDPYQVNVRRLTLTDREVLQMRIDMGVLQLETTGRPDGQRPHGELTYYHHLKQRAETDESFEFAEEDCLQIDREFVQFYNRRICWLQLKEFEQAVADADHTLSLMDLCEQYSSDESWTVSHEQYRPFVLYHRTQAAALNQLKWSDDPEATLETAALDDTNDGEDDDEERSEQAENAIHEINEGLNKIKAIFEKYEAQERFENDELVSRLIEFRESLRKRYDVGKTLGEQLRDAINNEQYERAAQLRDMLQGRKPN